MTPPLGRSRLLEHLSKRGKSQVDLALHLNVSESYISRVINGKVNLSVLNMRKTAKYLHCPMDDLIDWEAALQ